VLVDDDIFLFVKVMKFFSLETPQTQIIDVYCWPNRSTETTVISSALRWYVYASLCFGHEFVVVVINYFINRAGNFLAAFDHQRYSLVCFFCLCCYCISLSLSFFVRSCALFNLGSTHSHRTIDYMKKCTFPIGDVRRWLAVFRCVVVVTI
jgi:hypothetical protein